MIVTVYKDDADMMKEMHRWMEMLASFSSAKGVPERFAQLNALAKRMGDAATQEKMSAAVAGQVTRAVHNWKWNP